MNVFGNNILVMKHKMQQITPQKKVSKAKITTEKLAQLSK
jgi:hypothetical protein